MSEVDAVVQGRCFVGGNLEQCAIGISDGRIVRIAKTIDGDKVFDFGTKLVLPAAIDAHVHMREPGMTHKEDFASGSLAALHGGVTCVLDMPNTRPPTTTVSALREKKELASSRSLVDFGLFAGVQPGVDIAGLAIEAVGFKLYMGGTTGDLLAHPLGTVRREIETVASTRKVLAVHAEDESLRNKDIEDSLDDHLKNRNNECETSAVRKIIDAAAGCRLHICHVSAKETLPILSKAADVSSEVTPHHFLLDRTNRLGTYGKVNPPLRRREDRQAMFQALKEGVFDVIASDHAPHTVDEKSEDFDYAPCGMPGVETMLPLLLHLVRDRHLALTSVVRMVCERPGEIHGLRKGRIEVGYDADLVVVDLMAGSEIKGDRLLTKCGWTAFEGMPAIFPRAVFVRGEQMMEGDSQVGEAKGRDVVEGQPS